MFPDKSARMRKEMNTNADYRYLLVTPVKNEETFIRDLIISMKTQSLRPVLWVIVDDGSTDKTPELIDTEAGETDWVKTIRLPLGERKRGQHYAHVCKCGFDYSIAKVNDWDFIGLVDADMVLESEYFEKLVSEFHQDEKLGIASGGLYYQGKLEKRRLDHAIGGCRLFRRKCFMDIGGYKVYSSEYASADSIANTKAKIKGWKLRHFPQIMALHQRANQGVEGAWRSGFHEANVMYYFDYEPLLIVGAFISLLSKRPHYHAIAFVSGYLKNIILRKEHIPDEEIRRFFRKEKWQEIRQNIKIYVGD